MKKIALAAVLLSAVVAAPAFASGYGPAPFYHPQATASVDTPATAGNGPKTRAEVKAELVEARANGELSLNPNAPAYPQQFATGGYAVPRAQETHQGHFGQWIAAKREAFTHAVSVEN
ncbi:DUF4148 domain-containing protein [Paraburkholderia sp.]|uniref:DUF4148 domain-containing protein n=1 Tax=Paraburkholderia sp. TaxID=1926495 RepID=UPI002395FA3F|nr:DUF4148 domain-containing protein [Paraburkholderia sp.]MDE1181463.1 DUF4148 domain-containing protein [Paraburkholderia sp.]